MYLVSIPKFKVNKIIGRRLRLNHRLCAQRFRVHFFSVTSLTFFTPNILSLGLNNPSSSFNLSLPLTYHNLNSQLLPLVILYFFHPHNIKTVSSVDEGIPAKVESSPFKSLSQVPQVLIICSTTILKLMWESMCILFEMAGSQKKLFRLRWLFMEDLWNVRRHWSNKTIDCYQILSYALLSQMSFPGSHHVNTYTREHENTGQLQWGVLSREGRRHLLLIALHITM